LIDEMTGELRLLNTTAALLWACFDGVSPLGDICDDLAGAWRVPVDRVLVDTIAVVANLMEQGVVYDGLAAPPDREPAGVAADQSLEVHRSRRLLEEPPSG
jgi:hypothetical protein